MTEQARTDQVNSAQADTAQVKGAQADTGQASTAQAGTAQAGAAQDQQLPPQRVLTIPNVISMARLAGVPVFVWLVLGLRSQAGDWWAVGLLVAAGVSDWLDGKIARAWNQQSRLGELLDPVADRLYIVATVIALAVRVIIPWWLVGVLAGRELVLGVVLVGLWRAGYGPLKVSFVGKAATLNLLYSFPLLFVGSHPTSYATLARVFGWAFALWGSALYWWAAVLYAEQARRLLAADRPSGRRDAAACSTREARGSGPGTDAAA